MKEVFKNYDDFPALMSSTDLQRAVPLSRSGIFALMKSEGFPTIKIGKRLVVPKEKFLLWLEENTGKQVNV